MDRVLTCTDSLIDGLKSQAWVWASRQDDAAACRARLRRVEAAARNEHSSGASLPYRFSHLGRDLLLSPDASNLSSPVDAQRSMSAGRRMSSFADPSTAYVPLDAGCPLELHHGLVTPAFTPLPGSSDRTWSGSPADGHTPESSQHVNGGFFASSSSQHHQRRDWSRSH